jgi:hypothetical protein
MLLFGRIKCGGKGNGYCQCKTIIASLFVDDTFHEDWQAFSLDYGGRSNSE